MPFQLLDPQYQRLVGGIPAAPTARWYLSALGDCHRKRVEAAQGQRVPARRLARGRDLREPVEQPGEGHRALEPGERGANAEVLAAAEAERPAVRAQWVEPARVREPARI